MTATLSSTPMNRRRFVGTATGAALGGAAPAGASFGTRATEAPTTTVPAAALQTTLVADGLQFPEGPIAMADGSVILAEVYSGRVVRVKRDGTKQLIATPGGGPAGCAIGPDGALYVCNVGPLTWDKTNDRLYPTLSPDSPAAAAEGRIERIDLATGKVDRLYQTVDGWHLQCPDDLVFDAAGGFWFTDMGRHMQSGTHYGGLYYAKADGSLIKRVLHGPSMNGIGLSPDGRTLYTALTFDRQIIAFDITGAGEVSRSAEGPGRVFTTFPGRQYVDSMRVTADGGIAQAVVRERQGVAQIAPDGALLTLREIPGGVTPTSLCFGGAAMQDMWICYSGTGQLVRTRWQQPGLALHFRA
jgi:gluconolactonase